MEYNFGVNNPKETKLISLSPREAFAYLQDKAVIVDIRPEYEISYRVFDVPNVFYLPYSSYQEGYLMLPKDIFLIVADSAGTRCKEVACFLILQGYSQVGCLAGGVIEWDRSRMPLIKDKDYEFVGGCACRIHTKNI